MSKLLESTGEISVERLHTYTSLQFKELDGVITIVSEHGFFGVPVGVLVPYQEYLRYQRRYEALKDAVKELGLQFAGFLDG